MNQRMDLDGAVAPGFDAVATAFERNFDELGEIGAAVAVYHERRLVVDLAGGIDPVRGRAFARESLMMVASCTKGAMATCVLMLADAGVLDVWSPLHRRGRGPRALSGSRTGAWSTARSWWRATGLSSVRPARATSRC